jgi:hypothetical protein
VNGLAARASLSGYFDGVGQEDYQRGENCRLIGK